MTTTLWGETRFLSPGSPGPTGGSPGGERDTVQAAGTGAGAWAPAASVSGGDPPSDGAPGGRTLTVLVVEDDIAVAELLRTLLNRVPGWGATVVHDAAAATEVFKHVEVEMLVVDVNLPGISGPDLLAHLRRDPHWRDPPVILMSAHPEQPLVADALAEAKEHGEPLLFLAKPFDVDDLVDAVASSAALLRRRRIGGSAPAA